MQDFSVLLSVYGGEKGEFLRRSLASVFAQTVRAREVVLVEDGPLTEDLYRVVEEFRARQPELKVVPLPVNGGLGRALNAGLKHCSFDIVARMDTDDICRPDRFEKQLRVLREHPEVAVVSAWIDEFVDDPGARGLHAAAARDAGGAVRIRQEPLPGEPSGGDVPQAGATGVRGICAL